MVKSAGSELVSVVIPTFNRKALLKEAIDSVLAQTYRHLEILIMDDGSSDGTDELIRSYDDARLRYYLLKNHGKPAPARNMGIANSRGSFVAFLDSDDVWLPEKLSVQMGFLKSNPGVPLCATATRVLGAGWHTRKHDHILHAGFADLLRGNMVANSSVLVRRSALDQTGRINEELDFAEDYDLWLRLTFQTGKEVAVLPAALTLYRRHSGSLSSVETTSRIKRVEQLIEILSQFEDGAFAADVRAARRRYERELRMRRTEEALIGGKMRFARLLFAERLTVEQKAKIIGRVLWGTARGRGRMRQEKHE